MAPNDYGVVGGTLIGLAVIARFIWRWEKTFTDSAIDELTRLRVEIKEVRQKYEDCESEKRRLHDQIESPG